MINKELVNFTQKKAFFDVFLLKKVNFIHFLTKIELFRNIKN